MSEETSCRSMWIYEEVRKQTHFDHSSAFLPTRLFTMPSLLRQYRSSAKADSRSRRWLSIVDADMGAGERRSVRGCRGLKRMRHFLRISEISRT